MLLLRGLKVSHRLAQCGHFGSLLCNDLVLGRVVALERRNLGLQLRALVAKSRKLLNAPIALASGFITGGLQGSRAGLKRQATGRQRGIGLNKRE